jgi:hypothetical protein
MSTDDPAALQGAATTTAKRAQWEAFDFELLEVGAVRVTNNSHADPDEHTYEIDVDVETGRAVRCSCPADEYHDGPCKHRVAVENTPAVLAAASGLVDATDDPAPDVATDGGTVLEPDASDDDGDDERPDDCECHPDWDADATPCFACWLAGFDAPNPDAPVDGDDTEGDR